MRYELEQIAEQLQHARRAQNLSQRELSQLAGVPQAHISKIENKQVDLRLSSLAALANTLGLEVMLIPRQAIPAVQSIARQMNSASTLSEPRPAYSLDEDED